MTNIQISSFQGGLANDRNIGQEGAFWNSSNIEYRRNSAYIELARGHGPVFSTSSFPTALSFWGNAGTISGDILAFCEDGKVFNSASQQGTVPGNSICNIAEANGKKYMIGQNNIVEFVSLGTYTTRATITNTTSFRPVLNFYGDLIIGDGTQVARYNKDGTLVQYTAGTTNPVIGSLEGTVYALTQVGANIYVWTNDGVNTILYIWNGIGNGAGVPSTPSQKIVYSDMPVRNVALLGNLHHWWAGKSDYAMSHVLVGESYAPQLYIKGAYPDFPLDSNKDSDNNRVALTMLAKNFLNAIETVDNIVYLPGEGCIYGFGKYFPGQKYTFSRDITFTGTKVTAMTAGGVTGSQRDAGGFLAFSVVNGANKDIRIVNFGQRGDTPSPIYATSGYIETMEYLAPDFAEGENSVKITFPFELPHASTSIKVYVKYNRGSYSLIKTLDTTNYPVGYNHAEIQDSGKWKTKQIKFELITTNTLYTPKVYVQILNQQQEVGKR